VPSPRGCLTTHIHAPISVECLFSMTLLFGPRQEQKQLSTVGWLASLPVFEPHYQVTMAHGRGVTENQHSADVQYPLPPLPRVRVLLRPAFARR